MKRAIRKAVFSCHSGSLLRCYSSPPSRNRGSWLNVIRLRVEYAWRSDRMHVTAWELRITSGSPLCRGLTRAISSFCIEHLRMMRIEPGTSCTAGEYSMKRASRTAVFSCHSGSLLCCYMISLGRSSASMMSGGSRAAPLFACLWVVLL